MQLKPDYPYAPIGSIAALARVLNIDQATLIWAAEHSSNLYRKADEFEKADGSIRETWDAKTPLKSIQDRINKRIFRKVKFPTYLQGGVYDPDPARKRDDVRNASLHTSAKTVINEDIGKFFPTIQAKTTLQVWKHFFQFPHDVSDLLTRLTTFQGCLPQGASTSTPMANLIFFDREPELVKGLRARGLKYSRFIDDITVSADRHLSPTEKQFAISSVIAMFRSVGCRPNRKKHSISHSSERLRVHNVTVNSRHPTVPKSYRRTLRARVHRLTDLKDTLAEEEFEKEYRSLSGRISRVQRMHPREGIKLRGQLAKSKD